jgi:hypothetical protein
MRVPRPWLLLGAGLALGVARQGSAQVPPPPPPGSRAPAQADLRGLADQMADQVRHLGDDVAMTLRQTAAGRRLLQDAQELDQAVEEFRDAVKPGADAAQARRAYSGVDRTWHHLRAGLTQADVKSPAVDRAVGRVDQVDARLHQALGLEPPGDLAQLADQLAGQVRQLGQDIAAEAPRGPGGQHLAQDTQELAQAVGEFHDSLGARRDPFQVRRAYSGIDGSWHHLRAQLARPDLANGAIARDARRVDAIDAQVHQALGLDAPPADFYGDAAPTGAVETQRLANALESRAEALAAAVQSSMADDPNAATLSRDARRLARACDRFHDSIQPGQAPQVVQAAFQPVGALADRIETTLQTAQPPPPVRQAWQSFASGEVLVRQNLNLPTPPPQVQAALQPADGPSPIVALADQLAQESEAFLQVFSATSPRVPERGFFLTDATRLRDAAVDFRQDVARNLPPNQLAFEFRQVDALWQVLARRTARIARGRTGPNIQQVQKIGDIIGQMHQLLGMPGYAAVPAPGGAPIVP